MGRIASTAPNAKDFTNQRKRHVGIVDQAARAKKRNQSKTRARVKHVIRVVTRIWRFSKVRYRSSQKNATQVLTAFSTVQHLPRSPKVDGEGAAKMQGTRAMSPRNSNKGPQVGAGLNSNSPNFATLRVPTFCPYLFTIALSRLVPSNWAEAIL